MVKEVDVALSVYGKPFQTAATLASLTTHSGHWIDTVWFQEERSQPHGADVAAVVTAFPDINFRHFIPEYHLGWAENTTVAQMHDEAVRLSVRYQLAWERTNKRYLFITHNDCLYDSDAVGTMLSRIRSDTFSGAGLIGQCWNCPASKAQLCNGDVYFDFRPSYDEVVELLKRFPGPRTQIGHIDPAHPTPLPECRLNEFACLIDLGACRPEVIPYGPVVPFGYMGLDIGTYWFRQMSHRGHRFKNCFEGVRHGAFDPNANGHASDLSADVYAVGEANAHRFMTEHYPDIAARLPRQLPSAPLKSDQQP